MLIQVYNPLATYLLSGIKKKAILSTFLTYEKQI